MRCLARQTFTSASTNEVSHEDTADLKRIVEETPPLPVREVAVSACDEKVAVRAAFGVPSRELNRVAEWDILPQNLSDEEVILAPGEESADLKYQGHNSTGFITDEQCLKYYDLQGDPFFYKLSCRKSVENETSIELAPRPASCSLNGAELPRISCTRSSSFEILSPTMCSSTTCFASARQPGIGSRK